jgi:hypothetical protein
MSISVQFEQGNASPRIVRISTTSTLSQVTAEGWYNNAAPNQLQPSDEVEIAYAQGSNSAATAFFSVSISAGVVTLSLAESGVVLPVVSGDFAVFSRTSGAIADLGYLPSNAAKRVVCMANGAVTANELAVFADAAGTLKNASTTATLGQPLIVSGNISAGKSGAAGVLASFPSAATSGSLRLVGVASSGNFNVDISNQSHGQATVYSLADIGAATGGIPVATAAVKMKQVAQAAVAGGAAAQTVTDTFCTSGSNVICTWNDTTNAVTIQKAVAGNGSFVVTSSGDPGASHLNYVIFK